jgi:hypothetical protein
MRPIPRTPVALLAGATLALLLAGCASTPPVATGMAATPMGTVSTFHRKSSGSLGSHDGPVVWTQASAAWQGRPVVSVASPQAGANLHDAATMGLVAVLGPNGAPQMSFDPPIDYQWPLQVGKTWSSNHTVTLHPAGNRIPLRMDYAVESWGDLTVPAGTFKAFKLRWTTSLGEREERWVAPDAGIPTLKRHVERPASHPQGAGVLDAELQSIVRPAR